MDKRFLGLDGLRGIAAYMVVVHHTILKGTDIGGLSVFLFFILSGFLITGILVRLRGKIEAGRVTIPAALGDFWLQRALRIFPAYYVWLALFLPIDWVWYDGQTLARLGWYLLYVQNFLIAFVTHGWGDFTHTWSLAVEQQYYVFFAPLVLIVATAWHRRFFAAAIVASLAVITALMLAGFEMVTLYPTPSTGFVFMGVGALLAVTPRDRLAPFGNVFLVIGSAASLGLIMAAVLASPRAMAVSVLETSPFRYLGKISYALYIIHLPVALWVEDFGGLAHWQALTGIPADWIHFVVVSAVSIGLAQLSYVWVEKPFLDLKARLKDRAGAPADKA